MSDTDEAWEARILLGRAARLMIGHPRDEPRPEGLVAYHLIFRRYRSAHEPALQLVAARALLALEAYDQIVRRFGDTRDPELRRLVAQAWSLRGPDPAFIERFGHSEDLFLQRLVAERLWGARPRPGDPAAVIGAAGKIVERYGGWEDVTIQRIVARALLARGHALRRMGRPEEARTEFERLIDLIGWMTDPDILDVVGDAVDAWLVTSRRLWQGEALIDAYARVIARVEAIAHPSVRRRVAWVMYDMGDELGRLGRADDARSAYAAILDRYREAVPEAAAAARRRIGGALGPS